MATKTKFSGKNKLAKCRSCGKTTHSSIAGSIGIELCRACYDAASNENEHNDSHTTPVAGCRFCPEVSR